MPTTSATQKIDRWQLESALSFMGKDPSDCLIPGDRRNHDQFSIVLLNEYETHLFVTQLVAIAAMNATCAGTDLFWAVNVANRFVRAMTISHDPVTELTFPGWALTDD